MPNRHINFFRPFAAAATHENQLTRAALAVMRLVPLAHEQFLRQVDSARTLTDLPDPEFDTQTSRLHPVLEKQWAAGGVTDAPQVRIISVFLSPDVGDLSVEAKPSDRASIFDGIVRYGQQLIICIESKLDEGVDPWHAAEIPLGGLAGHCDLHPSVVLVRWHELLESWMRLDERGLLGHAERELIFDFFEFAGDNFADLLPFKTLARVGTNLTRLGRRLRWLLEDATGLAPVADGGWRVMGDWRTFERVSTWAVPGKHVPVLLWPGETNAQAEQLYGTPARAQRLAALNGRTFEQATCGVYPNVYVANWRPAVRQHTTISDALDLDRYVELWIRDRSQIRRHRRRELDDLFRWLVAHGLAADGDYAEYAEKFIAPGRDAVDLRPSIRVELIWPWADALEIDDKSHRLTFQINRALNAVLDALDEPSLPPPSPR